MFLLSSTAYDDNFCNFYHDFSELTIELNCFVCILVATIQTFLAMVVWSAVFETVGIYFLLIL